MEISPEQNMQRLRELTKELFDFSETVSKHNGFVDFVWDKGGGRGYGIYNEADASILVADIVENSLHQCHSHPEKEILIVLEGEFESVIRDEAVILKKGDIREIPASVPHVSVYPSSCKLLAITIPQSKDFPNVRR